MRLLVALALLVPTSAAGATLDPGACDPASPTHSYLAPWGTGDERAPLLKLGAYLDGAWPTDCAPDDGDRLTLGDGHYETAYGGAWLEASHHGAAIEVIDDGLAHVRFAIVSNTDPSSSVYGCVQVFVDQGTTTCPVGVDGARYVLILCDDTCPLHGRVVAPR